MSFLVTVSLKVYNVKWCGVGSVIDGCVLSYTFNDTVTKKDMYSF